MKKFESGKDLAAEMGCSLTTLENAHRIHAEAAAKQEKDPEGGPYPAYPSGKTWDEPSGKTGSGKKFFHNVLAPEKVATEQFYVAIVTPVIHYCMGGLYINKESECVRREDQGQLPDEWKERTDGRNVVPGLYCAGEAAGGVHGNNRLGGSSLLDCVVFGRVAARSCMKYAAGSDGRYKQFPVEPQDTQITYDRGTY